MTELVIVFSYKNIFFLGQIFARVPWVDSAQRCIVGALEGLFQRYIAWEIHLMPDSLLIAVIMLTV